MSCEDRATHPIPHRDDWCDIALALSILTAILVCSLIVFLRVPHELRLSHGLALLGAIAIFAGWFRYRNEVSVLRVFPAFTLILYTFNRGWIFHRPSTGVSTYDYYLLYADRGYGFQPSLLTYRFIERFGLYPGISAVYGSLILCLALCYAAQIGPGRKAWRVFAVLTLPVILGPLCYSLLPACGPLYLLGADCYTGRLAATCANVTFTALTQHRIDGIYPRNAMPSLHLAWALLIWWSSRDMKLARRFALAFVCATAMATMALGEHYLVDLVGAFPFALAVWSLCMGDVPLYHPRRILPLLGACATLYGWIACVRYAPRLFAISPIVTWMASAAIVACTLIVLSQCWPASMRHLAPAAVLKSRNATVGAGD